MNRLFRAVVLFCLRLEARLALRHYRPKIIAVTGSVGKTSTKDAIWALLKEYFPVKKSPKSYNSEIGVPLAILGLENAWNSPLLWAKNLVKGFWRIFSGTPYPQILVLEMGVDRPGDFDRLLSYVKPHVAVVTAIGRVPVHVEFFADVDAIAEEKFKLVKVLDERGIAILSSDDDYVRGMQKMTKSQVILFGFAEVAKVRASSYKMLTKDNIPQGITFKLEYDGKSIPIKIPGVVGRHFIYSFLAAAAVGIAEGLNLIEIAEGLETYEVSGGRLRPLQGIRGALLLDDSYNASPLATEAALEVLDEMRGKRKIAVLGDMLELGKFTGEEHRRIGKIAAQVADVLFTVGIRMKVVEEADKWFNSSKEAGDYLRDFVSRGDVILIKGSQGVRMERIVEALLPNPEDARDLLVRQESYWKKA